MKTAGTVWFSPLTRRRWRNFRSHRRGYWSLWLILSLIMLSLLAELIANDSPLVMRYKGDFYFPVWAAYPESTFGSVFDTEAEYTDHSLQDTIEAHGWMIWPPIPFGYDTIDLYTEETVPEAPSERHWLGTDEIGRDLLARLDRDDGQTQALIASLAMGNDSWNKKGCLRLCSKFVESGRKLRDGGLLEEQIKAAEKNNDHALLLKLLSKKQKMAERSEKQKMAILSEN